jgi:hypothetical protein
VNLSSSVWNFTLCALAVWRLTHLLAAEDGPWDMIVRLRRALGDRVLGKLMDCFYCLSLWLSFAPSFWLADTWALRGLSWLALSGAACLLEQATTRRETELPAIHFLEGDPSCAADKNETP